MGAGASTATWHMGKELAAMGHNITVITSGYKNKIGYDFTDGMTVFRCPSIRKKVSESNILEMISFAISAFIFLPWVIVKNKIRGCIAFFSFPCGPLGLISKLLFNIPYIVSLRGGDVPGNEKRLDKIHYFLKPLRRLVYKYSNAVVANSSGSKELGQKADSFPISVIPNGIDASFFVPSRNRKEKAHFDFLFSGRLSEQKNLFHLFDQFAVLKKRSKTKFLIHMAGDGPFKKELEIYAESLGLSENTIWYGWLDKNKMLNLYQESDCIVNPSFCEGMPNAVLEGMACGLPVVASNVPGNNEIVIDGQNGFLFDIEDNDKFQMSLEKISENSICYEEMRKNARKRAESDFSWRTSADLYFSLF